MSISVYFGLRDQDKDKDKEKNITRSAMPCSFALKKENCPGSTFKFCNFKASEIFAANLKWQARNIYEM